MTHHTANLDLPPQIQGTLLSQVLADPGLPRKTPTTSTWQVPLHALSNVRSHALPESTDFAIIGSGITGCSVARHLLESQLSGNKQVTVFEARGLTTGATSRNGGFLTSYIPVGFKAYADAYGAEDAVRMARFCDRNLRDVIATAKEEGLDKVSQIRDVECLFNFEEEAALAESKESIRMYEEIEPQAKGLYTIVSKEVAETKFNLKDTAGALVTPSQVYWPYRFITGLFEKLLTRHAGRFSIETHTPVTSITVDGDSNPAYPYVVLTPRGTVRAAQVFHCVSAFTGHLLPQLRGPVFPCRLTMTCQRNSAEFGNFGAERSWLWHTRNTFDRETKLMELGLYWMQQNAETGDLFVGGDKAQIDEMITSDDTAVSASSAKALTTILPTRLLMRGWSQTTSPPETRHTWSGILSMTPDLMPIVGQLPLSITGRDAGPGKEWVAAGFNGYGMSQCWSCGEAIALMALGQPQPEWLLDLYLTTEQRLGVEKDAVAQAAVYSLFNR